DYLELLLETGVAGTGLALFIPLMVLTRLVSRAKGKEVPITAAILSSVTSIAVHSLVDFNLHIPSNAILFALIMGMAFAWGGILKEEGNNKYGPH
ncbi:MAG: hypothetical protein HGA78_12275, partial [Nitrospirales bacterium]|nr:hypothetical protein [Nitrospirales bacterium]